MDVGNRLREIRKRRGLTQRELAKQAGVSLSTVRKLEQGEREVARAQTLRALAVALRVPTTSLMEAPEDNGAAPAADEQWAGVRRALLSPVPAADPDEPVTVAGTLAAVEAAAGLFAAKQFDELAVILPDLLVDADQIGGDPEGRASRSRLLGLTGWLLTQTRQFEGAEVALERALAGSTDRLQAASAVSTRCWLLLRQRRLGEARTLAIRWADEIEPRLSRATPAELSAWGWLLLRMAAAAVRDNRPDEADDALRYAGAAAAAMSRQHVPGGDFLTAFGPITVALKRAEHVAVLDRPDLVLRQAENIPVAEMSPTSDNRNRHLLDVADAHAKQRGYGEAVSILIGLQRDAPQWLPHQRYARDILTRVISHRRTLTPDMRTLAAAVGLPL